MAKPIQKSQLCVTIAAGNCWVRDSSVSIMTASKMTNQLWSVAQSRMSHVSYSRAVWVLYVVCSLFQDSRSCITHVCYCWCQAFLIKASITNELIHYRNVGKQNPVYKTQHTTCFWQHFLVRLLLKALEMLRTAEFAGKFVWRIVFIAWFSSAYLPSWSDPKVSHGGWRAGSVLKSMNCTTEDPSFISRSSQLLIIWAPKDCTPPSFSGPCSYVPASLTSPTAQTYFLKFFSFKVNF